LASSIMHRALISPRKVRILLGTCLIIPQHANDFVYRKLLFKGHLARTRWTGARHRHNHLRQGLSSSSTHVHLTRGRDKSCVRIASSTTTVPKDTTINTLQAQGSPHNKATKHHERAPPAMSPTTSTPLRISRPRRDKLVTATSQRVTPMCTRVSHNYAGAGGTPAGFGQPRGAGRPALAGNPS
ncbi:hypothetical protein C0992_005340, partial [Termitomyces sp. T32_za158]